MIAANENRLSKVYAAIADPTRRTMLTALANGELTVGALAQRFPITFNGVSKHVKVLERAGLVVRKIQGREHHLHLHPEPLIVAEEWLTHYRTFWEERLELLEDVLTRERPAAKAESQSRKRTPR